MRRSGRNSFTESGVIFLLAGIAGIYFATRYPVGTIDRVGAGFFPLVLSVLLTGLGAAVLTVGLRSKKETDAPAAISWRSLITIVGAIVFFGVAINRIGLLLTVPIAVFIGSLAQQQIDFKRVAIVAAFMTAFAVVAFSFGLGVRIPLLPGVG